MTTSLIAIACLTVAGVGDGIEIQRCGPMCLAVIARSLGIDTSYSEIDRQLPDRDLESSFVDLETIAKRLGLSTVALAWEDGEIPPFSKTSAIVPVVNRQGRRHFVVLLRSEGSRVLVLDFPNHARWIPTKALLNAQWDKNALHIGRSESDLAEITTVMSNQYRSVRIALWTITAAALVASVVFGATPRRKGVAESSNRRAGYSLIEILVAISIIGLLISLLAPAIQAARERARSVVCRNHLKQFGIASHAYHATYEHVPPATMPFVYITGPVIGPNMSAHARMLPFLEQGDLYRRIDLNETGQGAHTEPPTSVKNPQMIGLAIPVFVCPSDATPAGGTNYRACLGTGPSVLDEGTGPLAAKVGAFNYRMALRDRDISDGLTTTAFFSEKLVGDQTPGTYSPSRDFFLPSGSGAWDTPSSAIANCQLLTGTIVVSRSYGGASWLFGGYNHTWYNHVLAPNSAIPDCATGPTYSGAFTARSQHQGGVHVCFGDGSVRFIKDQIDLIVWRDISSRRGHETVSLDF